MAGRSKIPSVEKREASPKAALIFTVLAIPIPSNFVNYAILFWFNCCKRCSEVLSRFYIKSTALSPGRPLPIIMAKSSALLNADTPFCKSFSHGRSVKSQSLIVRLRSLLGLMAVFFEFRLAAYNSNR